jgi:Protein of unknown function (DUF3106)
MMPRVATAVWMLLSVGILSSQNALSQTSNTSPADINPMLAKSRIQVFRELLEMDETARNKKLSEYIAAKRAGLEAKIKEYEALSPEQRELRLFVTELQDYLLPLMSSPATNREAQIALLPTNFAPMIKVRLRHWDELSPEQQKNVLENKRLLQLLTEFSSTTPLQQTHTLTNMTPAQRESLQQALTNWQSFTKEQRQEITRLYQDFFDLSPVERVKTLSKVSEAEREQIQRTVRQYYDLNPRARARVRQGLDRFCRLTPVEFQQFLRSAERWRTLSPSQRKAWCDLVASASIQPPLPPGAQRPPSLPPNPVEGGAARKTATN